MTATPEVTMTNSNPDLWREYVDPQFHNLSVSSKLDIIEQTFGSDACIKQTGEAK